MKQTCTRAFALVFGFALAGCGEAAELAEAESGPGSEAASQATVATAVESSDQSPPADLVTAARGATLVSASKDERGALALIDGNAASYWSVATKRNPAPYTFVVELMAPAILDRVGIAGAGERPGGVAGGSAGRVTIEGSADGPETGFRKLATINAEAEGETLAAVAGEGKVRWLRYTVDGARSAEADFIYLAELLAYGALDPVESEGRFSGVFEAGRNNFIRLEQDGSLISGCYVENGGRSAGRINGSVVEGVALVNWRSDQGIVGTALFTRNAEGALGGLRYRQRSRTGWGGPMVEEPGEEILCEDEKSSNPVTQALEEDGVARLYGIQFDYDSDVPKPSARAALDQLFEALSADEGLVDVIEGHTDSDGSDDYNADLSQRRAEAVVADMVARGIDAERLSASGKGEAEPVASNDTADGKALNRRVEVRLANP